MEFKPVLDPFANIGPVVAVDKGRHSLKIVVVGRVDDTFELEDFLV